MDKSELVIQTKLAFDFIQKLYFESSYLIKEVEGLLSQESEEFVLGRGSGYAITTRSSNGLDSSLVNYWMCKKLSVFFIPKSSTRFIKGQTITHIEDNPKVIYMRLILHHNDNHEPSILIGVLKNFGKQGNKWPEKVEQVMNHIEYNETKVFSDGGNINYKDAYVSFMGRLLCINLYEINSSEEIVKLIIKPTLKLFRED